MMKAAFAKTLWGAAFASPSVGIWSSILRLARQPTAVAEAMAVKQLGPPSEGWRRGSESNRRMQLLQSRALPLGYPATHRGESKPNPLLCKQSLFLEKPIQAISGAIKVNLDAFQSTRIFRNNSLSREVMRQAARTAAIPFFNRQFA